MVGVLIRMRLRLLRHSLRGATRAGPFVVGALFGVGGGLFTAFALAVGLPGVPAEDQLTIGTDVAAALLGVWTLGWVAGPVVVAGSDETLQPEHFRLLPVGPRRLASGLLVSAAVGVPPLVSLVAFSGLAVRGATLGVGPFLVALVGVPLQLALVVALSRVVVGALGAVLRSRRGRDLGVLLATGAALMIAPAQYAFSALAPILVERRSPGFVTVLRALPSGWAPVAVEAAARSNWLLAVGALVGLALLVALLAWAWSVLLVRRMTTPPSASTPTRAGRAGRAGRSLSALVPATPVGAVAVKEVRTWWRDTRRRSVLIPGLVLGLVLPVLPAVLGDDRGLGGFGMLAYGPLLVILLSCMNSGNLYGFDGTALWHTLVQPDGVRADVRGRQLGWLAYVAPVAVVASLALPALTGRTDAYPWLLSLVPALLGGASGVVMVLSVFAAYPVPTQRSNPFAAGGMPGCSKGLLQIVISLLLLVVALPEIALVLAGTLVDSAVLGWAAVPVGVGVGLLTGWGFGRVAIRRLEERGPELLATVRSR
ncbi:ABC-2 type transport system permease protein [Streptoalloteichus tenebrarius]|uniref:ABC-2 type transport system permease protein n=1 Tax=Streptoalloteichus tenebrarius (strain ATCC 17920 / DSM 40477 / JCM 4838 / CBS 697.72 / NBRC 16177 / NCIMB 11028 / NRRL B-12390 / A12253. 1 / ISP 5477) TaxID=1933 RepID=A0ABT1HZ79_STRSD|nr:hypothetical protein [Streptoalloteichus tenebrarius]MCP2260818.1 ABC-2 type transport system permease protein [Streptoalloteichus tenebrarius]BFF00508.1 transporter [Streptoalloteichus tenebrarius]